MRFFESFPEALNELRRELSEMGINVKTKSVQNLDITNNDEYNAKELQNYQYTVTSPDLNSIPLKDAEWCLAEFKERVSTNDNPGSAWKLRYNYWKTFLKRDGTFDYAYPERMALRLDNVINALSKDPMTRRAFLPVFDRQIDLQDDFHARVPCSLGYWFFFRQGKLNVTYLQRSADFSEHFKNDIWLAYRLCTHIAKELDMPAGFFSHWLGSLHVFARTLREYFKEKHIATVDLWRNRNWTDGNAVRDALERVHNNIGVKTVIEGEARGADSYARLVARKLGIKVEYYPAEWEKYGKRAGPLRNQQMLDEGKPDAVLAFHDDIDNSRGTRDMVKRAALHNLPIWVSSEGEERLLTFILTVRKRVSNGNNKSDSGK